MADTKISLLPVVTTPDDSDLFPVVQGAAPPTKRMSRAQMRAKYIPVVTRVVSGNIVVTSTTWVSAGTDLVLQNVFAGDFIQVGSSHSWNNDGAGFAALMNCVSITGASTVVNGWSEDAAENATGSGCACWRGAGEAITSNSGGSVIRAVVAGDLETAQLTIRFRVRVSSADTRNLVAVAALPWHAYAKNHGQ